MRRRRTRKKFTYDSSETRTVLGLLFVGVAVLSGLALFTEGFVFDQIKNFFGSTSILFGFSFLLVGIRLLSNNSEKLSTKRLIALLIISLASASYLATDNTSPLELKIRSYSGEFGGIIGFETMQIVSDLLFHNAVAPLMLIVIFLAFSQVLGLTLAEYFQKIGSIFSFLLTKIKLLINRIKKTTDVTQKQVDLIPQKYGDFRSNDKEEDAETEDTGSKTDAKEAQFAGIADGQQLHKEPTKVAIKFKENDSQKGLLIQDQLNFPDWNFPKLNLLTKPKKHTYSKQDIEKNSKIIEQTLMSFGIKTEVVDVLRGPSVTQYALNIALGTKVAKIANLRNDLALALATYSNSVRIEAPIPGTSFVGIEVPNKKRQVITFSELIDNEDMNQYGKLTVTIGKNVSGENIYADVQKMPHLLIAGSTGSGKSVVTNSFIMSLLMKKTPDEIKLILVDPKQVEFSDYNGIPHLLTPVITDMSKVNNALKWAIGEMERRYTEFKDSKVRNIEGYNDKLGFMALPYIVIVIDEMADMLMGQNGAEIESSIVRLAQKARATGIHLILATQRPSVDVITGLIKANIPGRLALSVTTQVDSRVILDQVGAETLLGKGDLLYKDPSMNRLQRIQGTFISQEEVLKVVEYIKKQCDEEVEYMSEITKTQADPDAPPEAAESLQYSEDDLFIQAARIVVNSRKGSSSLLQRKLSIGYNRAARLIDELEQHSIVGPAKGSKPRDVIISDLEAHLNKQKQEET